MKDVKTKNRILEEKVAKVTNLFVHENKELRTESNRLGKFMFAGMIFSVFIYLFFVTSSIFYAVNTQKVSYEIEMLKTVASQVGSEIVSADKTTHTEYLSKKDRISYINRNADTAVTLK